MFQVGRRDGRRGPCHWQWPGKQAPLAAGPGPWPEPDHDLIIDSDSHSDASLQAGRRPPRLTRTTGRQDARSEARPGLGHSESVFCLPTAAAADAEQPLGSEPRLAAFARPESELSDSGTESANLMQAPSVRRGGCRHLGQSSPPVPPIRRICRLPSSHRAPPPVEADMSWGSPWLTLGRGLSPSVWLICPAAVHGRPPVG